MRSTNELGSAAPSAAVDNSAAALAPTLAELAALPLPPGADATAWAELKLRFRQLLLAGAFRSKDGAAKGSSAGLGVAVDDLAVADQGGGSVLLSWTYRHQGDYDQNSEVNIADLSPIGMHYGRTSADAGWQEARVADGDSNGEINIADLTPLGQNFGSIVTGYRIESTATPGDPASWTEAGQVPFAAGAFLIGNPFRHFTVTLSGQAAGLSYRVAAVWNAVTPPPAYDENEDNDSIAGAQTLAGGVSGFGGSLGSGAGYSGYDGDNDDYFSFTATTDQDLSIGLQLNSATGDIDLYLLDDTGAELLASEGTGNTELIEATVTAAGTFIVHCQSYSGYSDYTLNLTISGGGGGNQAPTAVLNGDPLTGASPLLVNWDAGASSDPDGSIVRHEWDWEDDGVWDLDSGADATVQCTYTGESSSWTTRLRVTDDGGLTSTATRQVQTSGGGGFVEPPDENFTYVLEDLAGYSPADYWLLNCYRPLPAWQDSDRVFQTLALRLWADTILTLVNQERAAVSLPALTFDPHLELVAQAHARDMALRGYHAHETFLLNLTPFDRIAAVDPPPYAVGEDIAGENIAYGFNPPVDQVPQDVMQRWMDSPGHQANILNPNVTHLGVGVYYYTGDPEEFKAYFVQLFANWADDTTTWDWLEPAEVPPAP